MDASRITRRRLMVAAAGVTVVAAASGSVFALRRPTPDARGPARSALPSGTPLPSTARASAASPFAATPAPRRGGSAVVMASAGFNFDTFDAIRTGEPSVVEVLGRDHSRLLEWADPASMRLGPDLARAWEQPAPGTLVLELDPRARWQSPLDRPVTAEDVAAHLGRLLAEGRQGTLPLTQRAAEFAGIRGIKAMGSTLVLETGGPAPFLPGLLASRFAFIQPPPSGDSDRTPQRPRPGSGPYVYPVGNVPALRLRAVRGGHREPFLDALTVEGPSRDTSAFIEGRLHEFLARDRRDAAAIREALPGKVQELARFEDSPLISSFFVGAPPWNRLELRLAISAALNRTRLARALFGGRAVASGPVAPVHAADALPETELRRFVGYGDEAADARDARRLWQAAGGPALGPITIDVPATFDPLYNAGAVLTGVVNEVLGTAQFRYAVETYPMIAAKTADHRYGDGRAAFWFGWGAPFPDPNPAVGILQVYRDSAATLGFVGPALSALLERLATETDASARRVLLAGSERAILEGGGLGVIHWLVQRNEVFRQPSLHRAVPSPFWTQSLDAGAWLES